MEKEDDTHMIVDAIHVNEPERDFQKGQVYVGPQGGHDWLEGDGWWTGICGTFLTSARVCAGHFPGATEMALD
jgi:hypothetical protein